MSPLKLSSVDDAPAVWTSHQRGGFVLDSTSPEAELLRSIAATSPLHLSRLSTWTHRALSVLRRRGFVTTDHNGATLAVSATTEGEAVAMVLGHFAKTPADFGLKPQVKQGGPS